MTALHIDERSRGPAVVLIHGTPTDPEHMWRLGEPLAEDFRVLVPHLPGYGKSPPAPEPYSFEAVNALLEAALAERGVSSAVLVGYSFGASRALQLALRRRLAVRAVVSLAGIADVSEADRLQAAQSVEPLRAGVDLTDLAAARLISEDFARRHPEALQEVRSWMKAAPASVLAAEMDAVSRWENLTPRISAIVAPVTARVGDRDVAAPVEQSRAIVEAVPGGRLEIVSGVSHALLLEDFDATLASVKAACRAAV